MRVINAGNRIMNTYVYHAPVGLVMIDTGYEKSLKCVEKKLQVYGVPMTRLKYVFLTHAHDDHAGFLNELLGKYPDIKVIVNPDSIPVLKKGQNSFAGGCSSIIAHMFCKAMALTGNGKHLFPPIEDRYFDRIVRIKTDSIPAIEKELGGKILFTPGHTCDSISLYVGNIIFCGDVAMNGFPSMHRITIWVENKTDYYKSWNILMSTDADKLFPAHGKPFPLSALEKNINYVPKIKLRKMHPFGFGR